MPNMNQNQVYLLQRNRIDDAKWDEAIAMAANSLPYAYTWYLDALCPRWAALVVRDYELVMPLPIGCKWGLIYVYQPLFCQQLGVFFKSRNQVLINSMLDLVSKKFVYLKLNANYANLDAALVRKGLLLKKNLVLSLSRPYEEIAGCFAENTIRNIRKGEKAGLIFKESESVWLEKFTAFYITHTAQRDSRFKPKNEAMLRRLVAGLADRGYLRLFTVFRPSGELCAGVVLVAHQNRVIHLLPATDEFGRKNGAMHYLTAEILKLYSGSNMLYDFEGSSVESIARFYEGFGADNEPFLEFSKNVSLQSEVFSLLKPFPGFRNT